MKIILNNDDGYNFDIEITDEEKNSKDSVYEPCFLVATLLGEIQSKVLGFKSLEKQKKSAFFMLDVVKDVLTEYYNDMEKIMNEDREAEKVYGYMEKFYEGFLERNGWSNSNVFEMLDNKATDLATILDGEEIRFSIVDKKNDEEIIVLNKAMVSKIDKDTEDPIYEAVDANAVATIIYDKMFGDDEENNPARVKGGLWFNEQAKRIVDEL